MNKKEKQQIKYLLENLKWYAEAPNEQDYNGEYDSPMEWEQGEAKIFLKYLEEKEKEIEKVKKEKLDLFNKGVELNLNIREKKDKEIERLNKELEIRIQNSQYLIRKYDELEEIIIELEKCFEKTWQNYKDSRDIIGIFTQMINGREFDENYLKDKIKW